MTLDAHVEIVLRHLSATMAKAASIVFDPKGRDEYLYREISIHIFAGTASDFKNGNNNGVNMVI